MPSAAPERGAAPVASRSPTAVDAPATAAPQHRRGATVLLAVVAAHRVGQPLHPQLLELGSCFDRVALTAPVYRLIALPGTGVLRGGIVAAASGGTSVEVELHELPVAALGELLCALPAPLALGRVQLLDEVVIGMVCASAPPGSVDISAHRSWLRYLAAR
jgi:allophanate hydrolase